MANINIENFGMLTGYIASDPAVFENANGSVKFKCTVAVQPQYTRRDGTKPDTLFFHLEDYIPAENIERDGDKMTFTGHYAGHNLIRKRAHIQFAYTLTNNNWTDKDGVEHRDEPKRIVSVNNLDSRDELKAREERAAARAAAAAPAVAVEGGEDL